ncbi:MAG: hypothetical protein V4525_07630 [Pseudomonadota bacterium]
MQNYFRYLANPSSIPQTAVTQECIHAFFNFLQLNGCDLNTLPPVDPIFALQKGQILSAYNEAILNSDPVFILFYNHYMKYQTTLPENFSKISIFSLFIRLGVVNGYFVEEQDNKNYDFEINWNRHVIETKVIRLGENDNSFMTPPPTSLDEIYIPYASSSLLVIDTQGKKQAFGEIEKIVNDFFPSWKHITAILAFRDHLTETSIGWKTQLFFNPQAERRMDATTIKKLEHLKVRMEITKQYT